MTEPSLVRNKSVAVGVISGTVYGIVARAAVALSPSAGGAMFVMTIGFLFVVPLTIGFLTVRPVARPSVPFRIFAPWISSLLAIGVAGLIGWEGSICVVMGAPVILILSSIGGLLGGSDRTRASIVNPILIALPYALAPIEARREPPRRIVESVAEIEIAAPVSTVWPLIASVDSIRPEEQHPALFTRLGFPRPISATLSRPGVGGIRLARFAGGVVFTETVTAWVPDSLLSFTIRPNTASIPPTTLDPHVTIGGPFFDVLTGTYELHALSPTSTRLVLRSRHRVSTPFNVYAGWWADRVMRSIQDNILDVHRARATRRASRLSTPMVQ